MKTRYILQCWLLFVGVFIPTVKACHPVYANISGPTTVCVGQPITFSGGGSSCEVCYITSYSWSGAASGSGSSISPTFGSAGQKTIYLTVTCSNGDTDSTSKTFYVVRVASLLPNEGTEIDDGDGNPDTKTFVVCKSDSGAVTVTATPNPGVAEANLPGSWTLTGGTGTGKLSRTVDKTIPGTTTITCTAGTSSKTIKIVVVEVDLDMAGVDESDEESIGAFLAKNHNDSDNDGLIDIEDTNISDGDPDLKEVTLTMNPALTVGTLKLTPDNGSIIRIYEYQDKSGGEVYSWDCSSTTFPKTVYIEGYDSTDASPIDLTLSYEYDNVEICSDIVKVTVAEAEIVSVPRFLFASATYATPIKFNIKGMGSYVWITGITGSFYYDQNTDGTIDAESEKIAFTIGDRFVAGNVISNATRSNGTSSTYTGLVSASTYSTAAFTDSEIHSTPHGYFVVQVTCRKFLGTTPPTPGTEPEDEDLGPLITLSSRAESYDDIGIYNKVTIFADNDVFAAEPKVSMGGGAYYAGTGVYLDTPITTATQQPVTFNEGVGLNTHISIGYHPAYPCQGAYPHISEESSSSECRGMNYLWGTGNYDNYGTYNSANNKLTLNLRTYDAFWSGSIDCPTTKMTNYGLRRGGYFYASYGGVALDTDYPVLNSGEFAMDINMVQGNFYWQMFPTGKVQISVQSGASSSSGIAQGISGATAIACAIAGSGPWAIAFGTVAGLFDLVEAIEGTVPTGSAFGVASINYAVDSDSGLDFYDQVREQHLSFDGENTLSLSATHDGFWHVGSQYVLMVNLDANLQAFKNSWGMETIEVKMEYYEQSGDLNSMNSLILLP